MVSSCPYAQLNPLVKTTCQQALSMAQVRVLQTLQRGGTLANPSVRVLAHLRQLKTVRLVKPQSEGWEITHRGKAALLLPKTQRGGRDLGTRLERDYMRKVLADPGGTHGLPRNLFKKTEFRGWVERRELSGQEGAWGVFPTPLGIVYGVAALGIEQYDPLLPVLARGARLQATEEEFRRLQDLKKRGLADRFCTDLDFEWRLMLWGTKTLRRCGVEVPLAMTSSPCPWGMSGEVDRETELALLEAFVAQNNQESPAALEVAA